MPLGQRLAHVASEGRRRIRDLGGVLLVGHGRRPREDESGGCPCPSFPRLRERRHGRCWRTSPGRPSDAQAPPTSPRATERNVILIDERGGCGSAMREEGDGSSPRPGGGKKGAMNPELICGTTVSAMPICFVRP